MDLDIWNHILTNCNSGKLFKSIQLLSKAHFNLTKRYPDIKNSLTNQLWTLIQLYPDNPWDWDGISSNPNITWEIIQAHPDKPWNWYEISHNRFNKH